MCPDEWITEALRRRVVVDHGYAFDSRHFNTRGDGTPLLTPANFFEDGGFRALGPKQKYFTGEIPEGYTLKEGSLVVVMTEQAPGLIGSAARMPREPRFLHNQRLGLVRALDRTNTHLGFVEHLFNSYPVRRALSISAAGTKVRHSSPSNIGKVECAWPPFEEQEIIAEVLTCADLRTGLMRRRVKVAQRRKRALLQQLLAGEQRFPEFRDQPWVEPRVGDVLQETSRLVNWDDDEVYRLASIRRGSRGLFDRGSLHGRDIKVKKLHSIREGDFLISHIQAAYGAMGTVPAEFDGAKVSDMYSILTPKTPGCIDMRFVNYMSHRKEMRHLAYLASNGFFAERLRLNFDPRDFLKRSFFLPPTVEEQSKIADALEALDREIEVLTDLHDALKEQKKGLMQQLLTGTIRVPESMMQPQEVC